MPQQDGALPPEATEVRRLIARGNTKSALDAAKQLHKRQGTSATEAVLVEAYVARSRSLFEHNLAEEAEALLAMVRERCPGSLRLVEGTQAGLPLQGPRLDALVRPLADSALAPETRMGIERELRTALADPSALAACQALPEGHPLRAGAGLVAKALDAVTSRTVDDAALELPEIPRRSPLAPWKPLLRAIACFYRHDDAGCTRNLEAIDAESAPGRLAPVLHALVESRSREALKPAAAALAASIGGSLDNLRTALHSVDAAAEEGTNKLILAAIRQAVSAAQRDCPEIVPSLRQHIAVRAWLAGLPSGAVDNAMGGPVRRDARYLLLVARATEPLEDGEMEACMAWDDFRAAAVKEGWFPARGPEAATLYLHMAELAGRMGDADMESAHRQVREMLQQYIGEEVPMPDLGLTPLHAEWLYEQACTMDPTPEGFAAWIAWAEKHPERSEPQKVAEAWHAALTADPRPLLQLMRYAEERGALKKALGYLREAEALDGLNHEVRRAHLRLLLRGAIRHLEQHKPKPALGELAQLEALPQTREGDRPAFLAGLRHVAYRLMGHEEASIAAALEMQNLLGGRAASYALAGISSLCGLPAGVALDTARRFGGSWAEAVARVTALAGDLGFVFGIPDDWQSELAKELRGNPKLEPRTLELFGGAALMRGWRELAYTASALGMEAGAEHEARFLVLRAQALPDFEGERRDECLAAALDLAHRQHDTALAGKALELRRRDNVFVSLGIESGGELLTEQGLKSVLARERHSRNYPQHRERWDDEFSLPFPRRRGGGRKRKPRPPATQQEELF